MQFIDKVTILRKVIAIVVIMVIILIICLIGPFDVFTHGFYYEVIESSNINEEDYLGKIELRGGVEYTDEFRVTKEHFRGFALYLENVLGNTGNICITIMDEEGRILGREVVDIREEKAQSWYQVKMNVNLKKGGTYFYVIEAVNCTEAPCLQIVDSDYLGEEIISDRGILISFAYAKPTFSLPEKILLSLLIICISFVILSKVFLKGEIFKKFCMIIYIIAMTVILSWNYMFNSFDSHNYLFENFQEDSETLVTGVIYAERNNLSLSQYGLGRFIDAKGRFESYNKGFIMDENWTYGYSNTMPQIVLSNQDIIRNVTQVGNRVMFSNGDILQITGNYANGDWIIVTLDAEKPLNFYKYGDLSMATYFDENMNLLESCELKEYSSQFGMQGKIFRRLARYISEENTFIVLHLFCCMTLAVIFSIIIILIWKKYNSLMAACFFIVFLFSPWIVNFSRNLYWVEFTWFIPMLVGLFCAYHINSSLYRVISYMSAFVAVLGKCLCGYEYISTVMMGVISFLLVDLVKVISKKDKERTILLSKTTIIIGFMALLGFVTAICIHADIRGDGNLREGIKLIVMQDVYRRTNGGNLNEFAEVFWPSFNASIWETFSVYFHFQTEII